MLRWLIHAFNKWRAPMLEAEKPVVEQDHAALFHVAALAADPNQPYALRRYNARVLRIAIERKHRDPIPLARARAIPAWVADPVVTASPASQLAASPTFRIA